MMVAIYGLCDPRDYVIRYVGKTTQPKGRLRKHIDLAKSGKHYPVCQWIRDLLAEGEEPVMEILDAEPGLCGSDREDAWIHELSKVQPLLNVHARVKPDTVMDFAKLEQAMQERPSWWRSRPATGKVTWAVHDVVSLKGKSQRGKVAKKADA